MNARAHGGTKQAQPPVDASSIAKSNIANARLAASLSSLVGRPVCVTWVEPRALPTKDPIAVCVKRETSGRDIKNHGVRSKPSRDRLLAQKEAGDELQNVADRKTDVNAGSWFLEQSRRERGKESDTEFSLPFEGAVKRSGEARDPAVGIIA
jgi:hypothetical protein